MVKMDNFMAVLKSIWGELDSVIELCVYLGIAYAIQKVFGIRFIHAIGIVFFYFLMNLLRVLVETYSRR